MLIEYIDYLKNNPEGYWFKRKLYGWGWTPAKWQGWLVMVVFMVFVLWNSIKLDRESNPTESQLVWFFAKIIISVTVLIFICYKKGEKPKWQWGIPKDE